MLVTQIEFINLSSLGYNVSNGVDISYARQASIEGKPIVEVESFAVALAAFTDWPITTQMKMLDLALQEKATGHKDLEQLIDHWLQGEIHLLYALARKDLDRDPALKQIADRLYDERNLGMLEQIEIHLTQHIVTTVMVGAGHLGGPKGLIALLTEKDYLVQQLNHCGEPL